MEQQVIDALRRVYRPGDRLATTLGRIAAQLSQSDVLEGAVCAFIGVEDGGVPPADRTATPLGVTRCFPVQYARQVLGALQVTPAADGMSVAAMMRCRQIAKCCAYLIKRDAACALAQDRLDRSLLIAGLCEETWMIDEFIEQAADSDLPIIVHGEFGTEKEEVAILLHAAAPRWEGPFVTVDCTAPGDAPAAWFERAAGGTLFLQGVDELDEALQRQLPGHLRGCQGPRSASGGRAMPRVIASTTADLSRRVRAGRFSRALLSQLDVLSIELAPLRKRRADIGLHVERVLDRHGLDHAQQVTDVLMDALLHYPWPENLQELERVVLRLAVMAAGRPIASADIHRHAPRLLEGHAQAVGPETGQPDTDATTPATSQAPADWIDGLPHRPGQRLSTLHDALRRALVYLGEHYAQPLTLSDLARQAHVSQSHLGFLFREELGSTFKPLLQQLRIEKAKELLHQQRKLRITEVALKVGFGDLSHFEKSFRRLVGVSPREFRNADRAGGID